MIGRDIVQGVYRRLKMPSQQALPYPLVVQTVAEVIARKKLDLALSNQNSLGITGEWFTPPSTDFVLEENGIQDCLLPIRVEVRGIGSTQEIGDDVPICSYEVLNTSTVGACSFYGEPLRLAFRDDLATVTARQYRVIYEPDFPAGFELEAVTGMPEYFKSMVVLESAWRLLEQVDDDSPEWKDFFKMVSGKWEAQIVDDRPAWDKYVKLFKGRAQVPIRTFWDNQQRKNIGRIFNS